MATEDSTAVQEDFLEQNNLSIDDNDPDYVSFQVVLYIFAYIFYKLQLVENVVKAWLRARFLSVYLFIWLWALGGTL